MSEELSKNINVTIENPSHEKLKDSESSKIKDKIVIDLNPNEGRWEYLYKLNKLKQIKNHFTTEIYTKEYINRELSECTFSPKINLKKFGQKYRYNSKCNSPSINSNKTKINNNVKSPNNTNSYTIQQKIKNNIDYGKKIYLNMGY
jgi:hypothetical protein